MLVGKVGIVRKIYDLEELQECSQGLKEHEKANVIIEKVIELNEEEYKKFTENFLKDNIHIINNNDFKRHFINDYEDGILIKKENSKDGIFVDSQGYDYARYVGYIKDVTELTELAREIENFNDNDEGMGMNF